MRIFFRGWGGGGGGRVCGGGGERGGRCSDVKKRKLGIVDEKLLGM